VVPCNYKLEKNQKYYKKFQKLMYCHDKSKNFYFQNKYEDWKSGGSDMALAILDIARCKGATCASDNDYENWLKKTTPRIDLSTFHEIVNWDLPIEDKRPIFKNIVRRGFINLSNVMVTSGSFSLEINKVIMNDDPL
jgi:hypothetical protein